MNKRFIAFVTYCENSNTELEEVGYALFVSGKIIDGIIQNWKLIFFLLSGRTPIGKKFASNPVKTQCKVYVITSH